MIHKISFKNFFSFKEEVVIDFVVDGNAPDTDSYFQDAFGNRLTKIMTVVGANASGKTNLLKSVDFLKWFIVDSFNLKPDQKFDSLREKFSGYSFCENKEPTSFAITFGLDDGVYTYKLELTDTKVISESLEVKGENKRSALIFSRESDSSENYKYNFSKLGVPSDFHKFVRPNASVISSAKQINVAYATKIVNYFSKLETNFHHNSSRDKGVSSLFATAKFYHQHPDIKEKAEKILKRFDLGISAINITPFSAEDGSKFYVPFASHKDMDSDNKTDLILHEESGGTRNLFLLLKDILMALETGNTVIFDELDNNLHPLMVPEIVNIFKSENYNPRHAQLFFSTHNAQILNELDKQQIILVEKNQNNISDAWKLSDIEGVRTSDNYYAKYLAGAYGGIPKF